MWLSSTRREHPPGTINTQSSPGVVVDLPLAAGWMGDEIIQVVFSDGFTDIISPAFTPAPGATSVSSTPVDLTGLNDGPISILVIADDPAGNQTSSSGPTATKDTFVSTPNSAVVAAGPDNAEDVVNQNNAAMTIINLDIPATSDANDTVFVSITDGTNTIDLPAQPAPNGGGLMPFGPVDLSGFIDGPLTIATRIADDRGNESTLSNSSVLLDTQVGSPTAGSVAAGPSNAAGIVNSDSEAAANFEVTLGAGVAAGDDLIITVSDGMGATLTFNSVAGSAGPAIEVLGPFGLQGLADGPLSIDVSVGDPAGNVSTPFTFAATKDSTAPVSPVQLSVAAGASNGANQVNSTNQSATILDVDWDPSMLGDESATITISSSAGGTATFGPITPPAGGGMAQLGPIDLSALADGALSLAIDLVDPAGNDATYAGVPATLASGVIAGPSSAFVAGGPSNPANVVNQASENAAEVSVTIPSSYMGNESISVTLSDGVNTPVSSSSQMAPAGGGVMTFSGINASSLNDGSLSLIVNVVSPGGATSSFNGTPATKDSSAPVVPSALAVAAGGSNLANEVNASNEANTFFDITWDPSMDGSELAELRITTPSGGLVTVPGISPPNGGGAGQIGPIDLSSLADGPLALAIEIRDASDNPTSFGGTPATKMTAGPDAPTAANVAAGTDNPADFINNASQLAAQVDVSFGATSQAANQVSIILDDGVNQVNAGPLSAPAGAGTISFSGIDASSLNDGAISVIVEVTDPGSAMTSFVGTPATKDTSAPSAPTTLGIASGASNNANEVNPSNVSGAFIDVNWDPSLLGNESAVLTFTSNGGAGSVSFGPITPPAGGGLAQVGPVDLSALSDGTVSIDLSITDPAANETLFAGTPASLIGANPAQPNAANVGASANNSINFVNDASQTMSQVVLSLPSSYDGSESIMVRLGDGSNPDVTSGAISAPAGGGLMAFVGLDLSSLNDGPLNLDVIVTPNGGSASTFAGTPATKDTQAPNAPAAVGIAAGAGNLANEVNASNEAMSFLEVNWDPSMDGMESATFSIRDAGGALVTFGPIAAPAGGGIAQIGPIDLSALSDGQLSIDLDIDDAAGNPTAFSGTPATKSSGGPAEPNSANVAAGAQNAVHQINISNETGATVSVDFPASSVNSDQVMVFLGDGVNEVQAGPLSAPNGAGPLNVPGIDVSSLNDGPISVRIEVTNASMATTIFAGTPATKDTQAPASPSAAAVPAGASNPADFINNSNVASTQVDVNLPASSEASDSVTLTLIDAGMVMVAGGTLSGSAGAGTISFTGIDSSSLADGPIALQIDIVDTFGNSSTFNGTTATKDLSAPNSPTAAFVAMTVNNPQHFVNIASQSIVSVEVQLPLSYDGTETISVTLNDGSNPLIVSSSMPAPAGGGTMTFSGLDLSGLNDGPITVNVETTDAGMNMSQFNGTSAIKDTVAPLAAVGARVASGADNGFDQINTFNETTTQLNATWDVSMLGDETGVFTFTSDGGGTATFGSVAIPVGGGAASVGPIDVSAMSDGNVTIGIEIFDPAGNSSTSPGTPAIYDATPSDPPTAAFVAATANNPQHFVNMTTEAAAMLQVDFNANSLVADTFVVTLRDSAMTAASSTSTTASSGAGSVTVSVDSTGLLEGPLTVEVVVTDSEGNRTTFAGTMATKDVTAPDHAVGRRGGDDGEQPAELHQLGK